jgi:hypothetical protein
MPLHDWTRVDDGLFHQQQLGWAVHLSDWLNHHLEPTRYYAPLENGHRLRGKHDPVEIVRASPVAECYFRKRQAIGIRRVSDGEYAALVEIVSPGVKSSADRFSRFIRKVSAALSREIHVLLIDPFPPTARDPQGLHSAIWSCVTKQPFTLPKDEPLTLASYVVGKEMMSFVEPIAVGDVLPDMPLFLTPDVYVNVPLESTYQAAWQGFPKPLRGLLEDSAPAG